MAATRDDIIRVGPKPFYNLMRSRIETVLVTRPYMTSMGEQIRILVAGAGIAGITLAYWLHEAGFVPIVLERAPDMRATGQSIELSTEAVREIASRMGLTANVIKSRGTSEAGLRFMGDTGEVIAEFGVEQGIGFTSELEILRGDLVDLIYGQVKDKVEFRFGEYVTAVTQHSDAITVELQSGKQEAFGALIICDGLYSKTRKVTGFTEVNIRRLGQYTAFFTIKDELIDVEDRWAAWYNTTGGRTVLVRPDPNGLNTRAYLSIIADMSAHYDLPIDGKKALMRERFTGCGWSTDRVLDGMDRSAEDFYMTELAQVRCPDWAKGRAILCGDAAYCPSPLTGMGTDCAIFGAYVLAGEISRTRGTNYAAAFDRYQQIVRPFVQKAQALPPGIPAIVNPQSGWGITVLRTFLFVLGKLKRFYDFSSPYVPTAITSRLAKLVATEEVKVPEYDFGH